MKFSIAVASALTAAFSMNSHAVTDDDLQSVVNSVDLVIQNLDAVWIVLCGIMVYFMQAGFALIECGATRSKNAVNVMMKNYVDVSVASICFWMFGYSFMFGDSVSGFFGVNKLIPSDVLPQEHLMVFFQSMFAATAVTIASGAMAERTKFIAYVICAVFLTAVVYPVFGHWVWNADGWLAMKGFTDFAGSSVVHSMGGWFALAGCLIVGARKGRFSPDGVARDIPGHNMPFIAIGGFILWMSWFGYNAGSTLAADIAIGSIVLNTHIGAASGALGYVMLSVCLRNKILLSSTVYASMAGVISISAGCASMHPIFAALTACIAGVFLTPVSALLLKLKIDDVVGAIPVHGVAGAWGTLAAGLFYAGDMFNLDRISIQIVGILACFLWAFLAALLVFFVIDKVIGLRVDAAHERYGLDRSEHLELAYSDK